MNLRSFLRLLSKSFSLTLAFLTLLIYFAESFNIFDLIVFLSPNGKIGKSSGILSYGDQSFGRNESFGYFCYHACDCRKTASGNAPESSPADPGSGRAAEPDSGRKCCTYDSDYKR